MSSSSSVIYLGGAVGPNSACINGCYEPTSEVQGGFPVYSKRGDAGICIEHKAGMWQVKLVSDKATSQCIAAIIGGNALKDCALRSWRARNDKNDLAEQPGMKMLTGSDAEQKVSRRPACLAPLIYARC
jgi:hypothetical protein